MLIVGMVMEIEETRMRGWQKTWWDCVRRDMESLSCEEAQEWICISGDWESRKKPAKPECS